MGQGTLGASRVTFGFSNGAEGLRSSNPGANCICANSLRFDAEALKFGPGVNAVGHTI